MEGRGVRIASGRINTSQQIGGAIGLAVLTAVASGRTDSVVGEFGPAVALNEGFQLALLIAAGIVVVAVALTAIVGRGPRRTPAQRRATTGAVAAQGEAR